MLVFHLWLCHDVRNPRILRTLSAAPKPPKQKVDYSRCRNKQSTCRNEAEYFCTGTPVWSTHFGSLHIVTCFTNGGPVSGDHCPRALELQTRHTSKTRTWSSMTLQIKKHTCHSNEERRSSPTSGKSSRPVAKDGLQEDRPSPNKHQPMEYRYQNIFLNRTKLRDNPPTEK